MTADIIDGLRVCVDCLMAIANGDFPEDEARAAEVAAGLAREEGYIWAPDCAEECEGGFSWSPCDACRSPLGGDRHDAALIPTS